MTNPQPLDPSPRPRLHGFDSLRAWAMLLGVVLHVVLAFLPGINVIIGWPIVDKNPTPVAGLLVVAIHTFRMPLFFFVSGLLTALSFRSRGTGPALRSRLIRIGVPFLVGFVTIIPAVRFAGAFALTHGGPLAGQSTWQTILGGIHADPWMRLLSPAHLWFLQYLLIYVLATAAIMRFCGSKSMQRRPWSVAAGTLGHAGGVVLACLFMAFMQGASIDTPLTLVPLWHVLAYYGVFFGAGAVVALRARSLDTLVPLPPLMALAGLVFAVAFSIAATIAESIARGDAGEPVPAATVFIKPLALASQPFLWLSIIGFSAWAARPRKPLSGLIDRIFRASYWTYLVHLPAAWIIHALLRDTGGDSPGGGLLRFLLVLTLTTLVCQLTYELLVARTPLARFLDMRAGASATAHASAAPATRS